MRDTVGDIGQANGFMHEKPNRVLLTWDISDRKKEPKRALCSAFFF